MDVSRPSSWLLIVTTFSMATLASSAIYDNLFAIELSATANPHTLAHRHGLVHVGPLGSLQFHHLFRSPRLHRRSTRECAEHRQLLRADSEVVWAQQQVRVVRVKRGVITTNDKRDREKKGFGMPTDPWFDRQWYLKQGGVRGHDMNVAKVWQRGITGQGVVVTILDDGIQSDHPDLLLNYDALASSDVNDNDHDPMPRDNGDNKHGTRCAGEVAAQAFNDVCGVGVAFNASIGGVRMLDGVVNDAVEATALSLNPQHIHVFSASWGPDDDGRTVDGPGPLAQKALAQGVLKGRQGLGSIFVWASGNGGAKQDNCNCDGYTNSVYTLSISSVSQAGRKPWYLEECASTLATTFSSGTPNQDGYVVTVDQDARLRSDRLCTDKHTGTSASAPLAAGIVALALQANPKLTWRDVQHLVVRTSNPAPMLIHPAERRSWQRNGVGRLYSLRYGYGLMDADALVTLAQVWPGVSAQHRCETASMRPNLKFTSISSSFATTTTEEKKCDQVVYLEHVQCVITLEHKPRGAVHLVLVSPSGTRSTLLLPRPRDVVKTHFTAWPFLSVHFWGEPAQGTWTLRVSAEGNKRLKNEKSEGILKSWHLVLFGTKEQPPFPNTTSTTLDVENEPRESDAPSCPPSGPCRKCQLNNDLNCLNACPVHTYESGNNLCVKCHEACDTCFGPNSDNCLSCRDGHEVLFNGKCGHNCPHAFRVENEEENSNGICVPCPSGCETCDENKDALVECLQCKHPLFLIHKNNNTQCVKACPEDHYSLLNKLNDNKLNNDDHEDNNDYDEMANRCVPCPSECVSCSSGTECLSCQPGLVLSQNRCSPRCPDGQGANVFSMCESCPMGCKQCSLDSGKICHQCHEGWTLGDNGQCSLEEQCEENNLTKCPTCPVQDCSKCWWPESSAASAQCVECSDSLVLFNSTCISSCPTSFYLDSSTNECRPCSSPFCSTCSSSTECTTCLHSYQLDPMTNLCSKQKEKCHSNCDSCFGPNEHSCLSCGSSRFFYNNTCLSECPTHTFVHSESQSCHQCHPSCRTCYGARFDQCKSCPTTSKLATDKDSCLLCDTGQHFDVLRNKCVDEYNEEKYKEQSFTNAKNDEVGRRRLRHLLLVICTLIVPVGAIILAIVRSRVQRRKEKKESKRRTQVIIGSKMDNRDDRRPLLLHNDREEEDQENWADDERETSSGQS